MMVTKKKLASFLAVLLAVMVIVQPLSSVDASAVSKVTYKGKVSSMGTTCGKFVVDGKNAFCAQHPKAVPPTGTKITSVKKVTNTNIRKALYYGYSGPKAKVSKNNAGWVSTSIAVSNANGSKGGSSNALKFYKSLKNYSTPPNSFTVYYCKTASKYQDLVYGVYNPAGSLKVTVKSADSKAISSNGYSLAGSKYGVYTKKSCTSSSRVATLVTGSSGSSSKVSLKPGTYYVKGISPSAGFKLNSTVYEVKITDQSSKTLSIKSTPLKGSLMVAKTTPSTDLDKVGCFSGTVYNVYSDSAFTKKVGTLTIGKNNKSNALSVYLGTYYIKEVKAPAGYLLDNKAYSVVVDSSSPVIVKIVSKAVF